MNPLPHWLVIVHRRHGYGMRVIVYCLVYLLSPYGQTGYAAEADTSCAVPPYLHPKIDALPNAARRIQLNEPLRVAFVGSGSMAGIGASAKTEAFPAQLTRLLPERVPNLRMEAINLAEERATLASSVNAMATQLGGFKPDLLIWQVGLTAIATQPPLTRFDNSLAQGIELVAARSDTDLLIMDTPFFPGLELILDDAEYRRVIEFRANLSGIPLFRTHDLMAYWSERRSFESDQSEGIGKDRSQHSSDKLHYCLANVLAGYIARVTSKRQE